MPSNYPGALDTLTNPTSSNTLDDPSHSDQHIDANDAVEAIEGELGTDPAGTYATVKARLDAMQTLIDAHFGAGLAATLIGTDTAPGGSTITLDKPGSTADGDLVILMVTGHNVVPNAAGPASGGGAWTERLRFDTDGAEWIAVYTKIASSEASTWTITTNNASATLSCGGVVVLRGPTTFVRQAYTDGSLVTGSIDGEPVGHLIAVWLSALAAGTQFSFSDGAWDTHLTFRVAASEGAMMVASRPTTTAFPQSSVTASAAGISGTWLGNLVMVWE